MALHALGALDDAIAATRRYRPRGLFEWLWVGIVATTVGSPAIGIPAGGSGGVSGEERAAFETGMPATLPDIWLYLGVAALLLWVLFVITGAFLEFPFLRWLRDGDLALRAAVKRHWRKAVGLAAFRLALGALSFGVVVAVVLAIAGPDASLVDYLFVVQNNWLLVGLSSVLLGAVGAFTTAFVVPTMLLSDRGVIGGWRRFWPTLAGAKKQFLVYAVAVVVLGTAGGLLVGLAALLAFVPALVVGLVVAVALSPMAFVVFLAVVGGVAMTVAVVATLAIVQVFLRYYALFVLGDVDESLDWIPERRETLRGNDSPNGDAEPVSD